jgi:SAM-dependent methyltransferase
MPTHQHAAQHRAGGQDDGHEHVSRQHAGRQHDEQQAQDPTEFWEDFYGSGRRPWSGRPNALLVDELTQRPLTPGTVLDLGCGSGADAVWFAEAGWRVVGVDISAAALTLAESAARDAGVADRITWSRRDLESDFPTGSWDLVVASYLHSPVRFARETVLRRAAQAVAPGGTLVVLGHQGSPAWHDGPSTELPTTDELLAGLALSAWTVVRADPVGLPMTSPDGVPGERIDHIIRLRRP